MTPENRTEATEAAHMDGVDVNPGVHRATEPDEEDVLTELYGEPDADGIFHGEGTDDLEDDGDEAGDDDGEEEAG